MPSLTQAQLRVLDYLRADTSGEFIIVPASVTNNVRTLDILVEQGFIEGEWCPAVSPPGSFAMVYRARR